MATVCRSREMHILVQVNADEHHIGDAYFKVYDSESYPKAQRVARVMYKKPFYVNHTTYNKMPWHLSTKERSDLVRLLNSPSCHIDRRNPKREYTNWEWAIIQYNTEICETDEKDTVDGNLGPHALSLDLTMPNYMELD
ncbi:MAG: hypothetical protein HUK21_11595 [Fibrobacteraceae bacterium]|nr:hypothetical protein [Fibrobacteraceae bacterium]